MLPVSSLVDLTRETGADIVDRFNVYPSANITADPAPGYTTGDAMKAMKAVADANLGPNNPIGWIGEAFQLEAAGSAGGIAFGLGLLMVFLILAAQYERLTLPLAVATAIPFGGLWRGAVFIAARLSERHLLPGRAVGADRVGREERHPDRGVRRPELQSGALAQRGGRCRRPPAFPGHR